MLSHKTSFQRIAAALTILSASIPEGLPADISVSDVCGVKLVGTCPKINTKVIGGRSTCAEKVPWNVLVEYKKNVFTTSGVTPYCGGVLITDRHVLSAAHCFSTNTNQFGTCPPEYRGRSWRECQRGGCPNTCIRVNPSDVILHLGMSNRLEPDDEYRFGVLDIALHPGWDVTQPLNDILAGHDIAVLTMSRSLDMFDTKTVPICLPNPDVDNYLYEKDRSASVAGFGTIIDGNGDHSFPAKLQIAKVSVTSQDQCRRFWKIRGNQVCAAGKTVIDTNVQGLNLVADSCNGDSGGGLTTPNTDGREVLVGIISFGEPDCGRQGGKPGVYTNVLDHLDWIETMVSLRGNRPSAPACTASNGRSCVFPFRYRGKLYPACTTEWDNDSRAWCSTKTDINGEHIIGENEWGHCSSECLVDIDKLPGGGPDGKEEVPNNDNGGESWSAWSACSVTCGTGTRTRTNKQCPRTAVGCASAQSATCRLSPCPSSSSASTWSAWSACSASCGGGEQTRTLADSNRIQRQGCNNQACPSGGGSGPSNPSNSNTDAGGDDDEYQEVNMWIVGGADEKKTSVEALYMNSSYKFCSAEITPLPEERGSAMGGYIQGRTYLCGGSSGDFENSVTHNTVFFTSANSPGIGWQETTSMPHNTSHAAYAVYKRKLYIIGGFKKPVCGYRPQVQVFDHSSGSWASRPEWDPPQDASAYGVAVTYRNRIFVTGGYSRPYANLDPNCSEENLKKTLAEDNRNIDFYQSRMLILKPDNMEWEVGPNMNYPRRNHGAGIVRYKGRKGILVAGGYNSKDYFMKSVEFLDFSRIGSGWVTLPDLVESRGSRLGISFVGNLIYVVGGDLKGGDTLETLSEYGDRWIIQLKKLAKKRTYATFLQNIPSKRPFC